MAKDWTSKYQLGRDIVHRVNHRGVPDPQSIPGMTPSRARPGSSLPSAKVEDARNWTRKFITSTDNVGVGKTNHVRPPNRVPVRGVNDARPRTMRSLLGLQENQHALTKILARYIPQGTGGVTGEQTLGPLIYSPSSRLRVGLSVIFEPDDLSLVPAFSTQPTWDIQAMSVNPETNRITPLQQAYPDSATPANLPDGYEFDTATRCLRADVVLEDTNFTAASIPVTEAVACILITTWEPNVEIPPEELEKLYAACSISYGQPLIIENNAV